MSTRLREIKDWLISLSPDFNLAELEYIQADASARKYLRVKKDSESFIVMDTQPGAELDAFIKIAEMLTQHNLNAPKIIDLNLPQGLLLLNDFGNTTYLSVLKKNNQDQIDHLYMDAIVSLIKLQRIPTANNNLKSMDDVYISDRLNVFKTWYLQRHLGLEADARVEALIKKMQILFSEAFQAQPQVFVHVDYHSRNLMVVDTNNPGILDFQDAMIGPASYDLVSLLQDAYFYLPRKQVESWVETFRSMGVAISLRDFDLVGLQRHIKNLGVFARLHHRDQKSNYLNDMPMLIKYITETCSRYTELNWLLDFVTELVGSE